MTTTETQKRPLASVSLDLDNLWSYLKTSGDPSWQDRPSYLESFTPFMLDLLDRLGITITVFVVGADAANAANGPALRSLVGAGHEVGNHSYEHDPRLRGYSLEHVRREVRMAGDAIAQATGKRPSGFRAPGFSWSPLLLQVLLEEGYEYDASTLPSFLGPLARAYYFRTAKNLTAQEREELGDIFGSFSDGLKPLRPYHWSFPDDRRLLEMPVTTMPVLRTPFHFSYLAYLAGFSERLMFIYLNMALAMCRVTGTEPSFLLHPLDAIGADKAPALAFFPGMQMTSEKKSELLARVLDAISQRFEIVPMGVHAAACEVRGRMQRVRVRYDQAPTRSARPRNP